jgi:hypothetical protein
MKEEATGTDNGGGDRDARMNFILQQGFAEPTAASCPLQYRALLFQPRVIGVWLVVATILQAPVPWWALAVVLWWSALLPRFSPFDALYNLTLARRSGARLTSAPPPRRFAQFLAGSFAVAIALSLTAGLLLTAQILEGVFIAAVAALAFGAFCLGSFMFHVMSGQSKFARRTLPWSRIQRPRAMSSPPAS